MANTENIDGIELTWYLQSAFKVKADGKTIWIDPHRISDKEVAGDKADVVFITHSHPDHMDAEALAACGREGTVLVTTAAVAAELKDQLPGGINLVTVAVGEEGEQAGVKFRAVAAYNEFHPQGDCCGFVLSLAGKTLFHAGDTNNVPEFANVGPVDLALYPIGGTYTSDEEDAAAAVRAVGAKTVVPMHYGYATEGDAAKFQGLVGGSANVVVMEPVLDVKYG